MIFGWVIFLGNALRASWTVQFLEPKGRDDGMNGTGDGRAKNVPFCKP